MESTRRFKRPRNVFRAVRILRTRPDSGSAAPAMAADAAEQDAPLYESYPHLSLVTDPKQDDIPGDAGEPDSEGEPPKGRGYTKRILLGLVLVVVAAGAAYAVYETRTSTLQAKIFAGMM